jgi:hypothetical protein
VFKKLFNDDEELLQATSLERPVVVKGKKLIPKIKERLKITKSTLIKNKNKVENNYNNCIEGTKRSQEKRELLNSIDEYEQRVIWLNRLLKVLKKDVVYSLTIQEALSLNIIED